MANKNVIKKAKVVKAKKKFNWSKVFYYLKSLFSNDRCAEVGSHTKWYWSIPVFVLSIGLAMIPLTVHTSQAAGSNYMVNSPAGDTFYTGLSMFSDDETNKYDISFDLSKHEARLTSSDETNYPSTRQKTLIYAYNRKIDNSSSLVSSLDLEIYFVNDGGDETIYRAEYEAISKKDNNGNDRNCSFIVFGTKYFNSITYVKNAAQVSTLSSSIGGDYLHLDQLFNKDSMPTTFTFKTFLNSKNGDFDSNTIDATFENYADFVDVIYITNKNITVGVQSGIILGINGGIILIMGLIFFIMTRGKNNPNRTLTFWQTSGIAIWTSITPALLSLILGFMLTGFEVMLFVLIYGFRAMWLSMKQLRPVAN